MFQVLPLLKEVTAYLMLRPLLPDVPLEVLPGAVPGKTFHVSGQWHPALALNTSLVPIPRVHPGDTVWWHPDLVGPVAVAVVF